MTRRSLSDGNQRVCLTPHGTPARTGPLRPGDTCSTSCNLMLPFSRRRYSRRRRLRPRAPNRPRRLGRHEELGSRNLPCVACVVAESPQWCTRSCAISAYGQTKSERVQEGQELFLLLLPQIREPALRIGCLAAVAENGVPQGQRLPVVHEPTVSPHTPERRGPKPGSGHLVLRLHMHE